MSAQATLFVSYLDRVSAVVTEARHCILRCSKRSNALIHLLKAPGPRRAMANGRMSVDQLATARQILVELRQRITGAAGTDQQFAFALRRYVFKNLSYDERDT